ncbi:hypothetical protein MTR_6g466010 [Medicago truncatula]|uniref:Uncharacterized protein n=1 Tax=Medicago truncatula TaxID=3880 RepID=A0A072UAD4_MEDTR|nr:hypothetical protein MTR_6g466010 [Medicago truncatula]
MCVTTYIARKLNCRLSVIDNYRFLKEYALNVDEIFLARTLGSSIKWESKSFLILIEESRQNIKPRAHSQNFDEARLKEQSRVEVKQKAGKHDFKH